MAEMRMRALWFDVADAFEAACAEGDRSRADFAGEILECLEHIFGCTGGDAMASAIRTMARRAVEAPTPMPIYCPTCGPPPDVAHLTAEVAHLTAQLASEGRGEERRKALEARVARLIVTTALAIIDARVHMSESAPSADLAERQLRAAASAAHQLAHTTATRLDELQAQVARLTADRDGARAELEHWLSRTRELQAELAAVRSEVDRRVWNGVAQAVQQAESHAKIMEGLDLQTRVVSLTAERDEAMALLDAGAEQLGDGTPVVTSLTTRARNVAMALSAEAGEANRLRDEIQITLDSAETEILCAHAQRDKAQAEVAGLTAERDAARSAHAAALDRSLTNACRAEWAQRLVGELGVIFALVRQLSADPHGRKALLSRAREVEATSRSALADVARLTAERAAVLALLRPAIGLQDLDPADDTGADVVRIADVAARRIGTIAGIVAERDAMRAEVARLTRGASALERGVSNVD